MTIRLYFDEDSMRHALVRALRERDMDILTALEAGTIEQTDERQLEYAAVRGRVIYSFNIGDFCRIHAQWLGQHKSHAGIVVPSDESASAGSKKRDAQDS